MAINKIHIRYAFRAQANTGCRDPSAVTIRHVSGETYS